MHSHTQIHRKFPLKKIFNFLKGFIFGRDTLCFIEQNKKTVFLLNFSCTALYHLSQSLANHKALNFSVPTAPAVRLFIMQPLTGRQHNVTRHENHTNFPEKGNRRANTLLFAYHFCFQSAGIKQWCLQKDLRTSLVFKWDLHTCDLNGESPVL